MDSATLITEEKDLLFPNCFDSFAWNKEKKARLQQTKELIPDYDGFEFDLHSVTIPNVTLKHVLDMMYCPLPVKFGDGIERPSLMLSRFRASECDNITVPQCFTSFPSAWMDWNKQSLDVPLMHEF